MTDTAQSTQSTHHDDEFAGKIVKLLGESTREIDGVTAARLLQARKEALAHFHEKPVRGWAPAWATDSLGRFSEPFSHNVRASVALLAFLAAVAAAVALQTFSQPASEIAEIDVGLLTDDLPINAYLDKGFDSWAKRP